MATVSEEDWPTTGSPPERGDREEIEAIVKKARAKEYGLRALVHEIVQSRLFRHK